MRLSIVYMMLLRRLSPAGYFEVSSQAIKAPIFINHLQSPRQPEVLPASGVITEAVALSNPWSASPSWPFYASGVNVDDKSLEMMEDLHPPEQGISHISPDVEDNVLIEPPFFFPGYLAQNTEAANDQVPYPRMWEFFPPSGFPHPPIYPTSTAPVGVSPPDNPGVGRYLEPTTPLRYTGFSYSNNEPGPSTLQYITQIGQPDNSCYTGPFNESNNPIPTPRANSVPKADPIPQARPAPGVEAPLLGAATVPTAAIKRKKRQEEGKKDTSAASASLAPEVPGGFVCPFRDCKHTKPFSRKHNLIQHRRGVHKEIIPKTKFRFGNSKPEDNQWTQRNGRRSVVAAELAETRE